MEKTDVVIEQITSSEMYNKLIAEAGGWDEFCKEWEVEIVPEGDDEIIPDFNKDGKPYYIQDGLTQVQYDHDWFRNQFFK